MLTVYLKLEPYQAFLINRHTARTSSPGYNGGKDSPRICKPFAQYQRNASTGQLAHCHSYE